jgi:hypothetical protein
MLLRKLCVCFELGVKIDAIHVPGVCFYELDYSWIKRGILFGQVALVTWQVLLIYIGRYIYIYIYIYRETFLREPYYLRELREPQKTYMHAF